MDMFYIELIAGVCPVLIAGLLCILVMERYG